MTFPTRYNAHLRGILFGVDCGGESRTKQSFQDECDINSIMRRYVATGTAPGNVKTGRYGDFSNAGDFLEAQETLIQAREQFAALPAAVRSRFRNNPLDMLEFVGNPGNRVEAQALGLLREEPSAPGGAPPGGPPPSQPTK